MSKLLWAAGSVGAALFLGCLALVWYDDRIYEQQHGRN